MSKVKRNLSLEEDILDKGLVRAKDLGYNFSSYITYLINKDCNNIDVNDEEIEKIRKNRNKKSDSVDSKIMAAVDNIIDGNI